MPKRHSSVWLYFKDEDGKRARCKFCDRVISFTGGSHSNLKRHMRSKHASVVITMDEVAQATEILVKQELNDILPSTSNVKKQQINDTVFSKNVEPPLNESIAIEPNIVNSTAVNIVDALSTECVPDAGDLDRQLLKMIIKGQHSFRLVQEPAFRELINSVSKYPGYSLPSRKKLSNNLLPKVHKEILENVKNQIQDATDVCLAFDKWSSRAEDSYVALTAHYINPNTELKSPLLACQQLRNDYTAQSLYNFLNDVIREFSIDNKITVIVSDNTPDFVEAIDKGKWLGISCFAHSLNSTVQNALEGIAETIYKVRKIASYMCANLEELNEFINLPGANLKEDDPNIWTTTYEMLQSINEMQDAVVLTISSDNSDLILSSRDWDIIAETLPILKPFYEVVLEISEEKHLYLSKVTILCNILETFVSQNFPINEEVGAILSNLQIGLYSCFGSVSKEYLYAESTLLDPRFKRRGFKDEESYRQAVQNLKDKISAIKLPNDKEESSYGTSNKKSQSLWNDYDTEFRKTVKFNSEFDKYLSEEYLDRKLDPILWWKQRKGIYPRVYQYAVKRLCIVATSVPCERIFSATGQILVEKRTALKPSTVEGLVFLHTNM